ncbi:MAG TPA: pectate lyase, partial [Brevundimonas sp.]
AFEESNPLARAWFEGNAMDGQVPADPWTLVKDSDRPDYRMAARPDWAEAATETASEAEAAVLARTGAGPVRDAVDGRIVAGVRARSLRIIDSPSQVGGWPELAAGKPWVDGDGDGMPDDWETANGLNPAEAADGTADRNGDGWTNLEDWLDSLARPAD